MLVLSIHSCPFWPRFCSCWNFCEWVGAMGQFSLEFEEPSDAGIFFVRTWDTFRGVCVAVLSKCSREASRDAVVLGQLLSVVGPLLSLFALVGGSHELCDTYVELPRSWYQETLVEYPTFDLQLLERCLQKYAAVVFGSLHPFSMAEFIIVRLKGAEHKDWMACRHALRRAVVSGDFWMPSLVETVGNIVGVWPLIGSFLIVSWYSLLQGFVSVFSSVTDGTLFFRRRKSMDTCILIRRRDWSFSCSLWFSKFVYTRFAVNTVRFCQL